MSDARPAGQTTGKSFFATKYGMPDGREVERCAAQRRWGVETALQLASAAAAVAGPAAAAAVARLTNTVAITAGVTVPTGEALRLALLNATISVVAGAHAVSFTSIDALAMGEVDEDEPSPYAQWLLSNFLQLLGTGVPQRLWHSLWMKLRAEVCKFPFSASENRTE